MRRAYLFVYNAEFGTREATRKIVEGIPEIINWRYELPSSFYLVSELMADDLARRIRGTTGDRGRFIITEVESNKQGWLDPKSWKLINEKPDPK